MAVDMNETETKYDAPAGADLPRLDRLPQVAVTSGPEQQRLEADYYDTDDLRLIRAGITLRRRSGGHDDGWHLKLPLGGDTRREIRRPLGGAQRRVPEELAHLVRVHTRGAPLVAITRMITTRQRLVLLDEEGESLAEVAADDVSAQTLGPEAAMSRWQEVEVELTGGDQRLLRAADELLRHDGLRPAGRTAKLARALGDRLPGPADRPRLTASSPAGQVVLAYLRAHAERLKALDPFVRLDEPDAVHQMRVAGRRLRATLRSFGHVLSQDATSGLAADLKWLGGALGPARDGEVLPAELQSSLRRAPGQQAEPDDDAGYPVYRQPDQDDVGDELDSIEQLEANRPPAQEAPGRVDPANTALQFAEQTDEVARLRTRTRLRHWRYRRAAEEALETITQPLRRRRPATRRSCRRCRGLSGEQAGDTLQRFRHLGPLLVEDRGETADAAVGLVSHGIAPPGHEHGACAIDQQEYPENAGTERASHGTPLQPLKSGEPAGSPRPDPPVQPSAWLLPPPARGAGTST